MNAVYLKANSAVQRESLGVQISLVQTVFEKPLKEQLVARVSLAVERLGNELLGYVDY